MKREDIYIEVTPETIGAYEEVLRRHGERVGDIAVQGGWTKLQYSRISWWVLRNVHDRREYLPATPEEFDKWLTDLKAAEAPVESEPVYIDPGASVGGNVVPIELDEPAKTTTLLFTDAGTFEPVEVCKGWEVVLLANGERECVPTGRLFSGTLKPLQP